MKRISTIIITTIFSLYIFIGYAAKPKVDIPWENGQLKVSDNAKYLEFENGNPFFWLGETAWLMPSRLNRSEVGYFLEETKKSGFNIVQISVLHNVSDLNIYGKYALPYGFNFKNIEKSGEYSYWNHVDYIIESAAKQGIYVGIVCVWGGNVKNGLVSESDAKKYGTFLANRYKNSPNIIWIVGGDVKGDIKPEVWNVLANTIKSIDKHHLMTFHPFGRTCSSEWFNNTTWLDFNMFQSGHRRYGQTNGDGEHSIEANTEEDNWRYVEKALAMTPVKPVLDGEPSYEDIPEGLHDTSERRWQAEDVRRYAYWSVFAGACGHTYGNNSTMQFQRLGYGGAYGATRPWYETIHDPGCIQMQYVKKLIMAFPYFDRIPDQTVITAGNGAKYDRAIATRGKDYILIYNYSNREIEIDLNKISGAKKNAWWYNPRVGSTEYIGSFKNGKHTFVNRSGYRAGNDWVLIVTDSAVSYVEKNLSNKPQ